jgi:hypothetical protein
MTTSDKPIVLELEPQFPRLGAIQRRQRRLQVVLIAATSALAYGIIAAITSAW